MAFSFPSNPTLNQTYTFNSNIWKFNGKGWAKDSTGGASVTASATAPASPTDGAMWLENESGDLYVYGGGNWILTGINSGPSFSGSYNDLTDKPTITSVVPSAVSDQNNTSTGAFDLPSGTTAQRPASPSTGYTRINTTNNSLEVYSANAWNAVQYFGYISATGGVITTIGDYKLHTFLSSDNFTVTSAPANAVIEYLVVAGGGGGGSDMGGGGGAGGVLAANNLVVSAAMYYITIGAGGAGGPAGISQVRGTNGSNSVIGASGGSSFVTALGGGGGASEYSNNNSPAGSGGSGGGAAGSASTSFGLGTAGQGYNGSIGAGDYYPGGGGGAGGAGTNNPANGGIGIQNAINGTNYYWGGGGGGGGYSTYGGNGGQGGGGGGAPKGGTTGNGGTGGLNPGLPGTVGSLNSQTNVPGGNGGANTGGGGGGGAHYNSNNYGGTGGSGIVIIKYRFQ